MNIKSLLLGSAAAMVAVSGAQAADAVVIEPEPVEFVRVCDAYGSGFFFIPGTETCIRFGGFVRSSYEAVYVDSEDGGPDQDFKFWGQRARLNVDVRSETDFGTLRALYRLEGGDSNTDADIDMDIALISLAGFRAGFAGANYWSTNHGFAGVNLTGLGGTIGAAQDDGYYGFNDATIFDYTYAVDGFSVTVGVEDPRINYNGLGEVGNTFSGGPDAGGVLTGGSVNTNSRANFYAGVNYSADFGSVAFTYVRDSQAIDSSVLGNTGAVDFGGDAFKVSLSLDLSEFIPGGILYGSYAWDDDAITNYVHTNALGGAGIDDAEEIFQISFQANLTDELELVTQYSHADGSDWGLTPGAIAAGGNGQQEEQEVFSIGLNWFPAAAPQFSLRASYVTGSVENAVGAINNGGIASQSYDFDGFFVGVRRDF